MKRNYRNLFMAGVCAFLGMFASCDDQPVEGGNGDGDAASTETSVVKVAAINASSATFMVKDLAVESLAYYVHEGVAEEDELDPIILFSDAQEEGRIATLVDNQCTFTVYSLEGNKEYTVYVMYTENDELVTESATFMTASYDRIINVVESRKDGFTLHFNVPEGMTYMFAFVNTEQYGTWRNWYGANDKEFLEDGRRLTGPQTVTYNSNEDWLWEEDGGMYIHPGSTYTVIIGECDEEGNLLCDSIEYEMEDWYEEDWYEEDWNEGEAYDPMPLSTRAGTVTAPRKGAYTEVPWYDDDFYPCGLYARQNLIAAFDQVDSKVNVELTKKTERRIKLRCTAKEDVQYVVAPMEKSEYKDLEKIIGKESIAPKLLEYYSELIMSGTQDLVIDENMVYGMEVGTTWIVSVIGIYAEDASVISYDTLHVTLTPSTLPAAEITVEGCDNPEGEPTPNLAWFRVKSESKNVASANYVAHYTKEVAKQLNYGYTYEELVGSFGNPLEEKDIIEINSDEGAYIAIPSMEDAATTLIVAAYNEDDVASVAYGESRTPQYSALPEAPGYQDLCENLKGDWTVRIIQRLAETFTEYETDEEGNITDWENYVTIDSVWYDTLYTTITFGESFDNSPATFDESHEAYAEIFDTYYWNEIEKGASDEEATENAKAQVEEQFATYKSMAKKYEEKYKGQNYILAFGLDNVVQEYATPWDLFCSSDYSAYDVEELFYDYGPKLFFQVQEDGSLYLLGDGYNYYLPPVAGWDPWYDVNLGGYNPDYADMGMFYSGGFLVEVEENSMVIKAAEEEGEYFYPAFVSNDYGWPLFFTYTCEEIVLTRGAAVEDEDMGLMTRAAKAGFNKPADKSQNNRIKRTYLPTKSVKVKTSSMPYVPVLDNLKAKYNK